MLQEMDAAPRPLFDSAGKKPEPAAFPIPFLVRGLSVAKVHDVDCIIPAPRNTAAFTAFDIAVADVLEVGSPKSKAMALTGVGVGIAQG